MFEFPAVSVGNQDSKVPFDENIISITKGREFNVRVNNALRWMGGCDYLILGGLSDDQKSYLDFLEDFNVLYIDNCEDADAFLKEICNKQDYLVCKEDDIYGGLFCAALENKMLKLDSGAESCKIPYQNHNGIIVIENNKYVSSIIAINYALSINSDISIIEPPLTSIREIHSLIEKWQERKENKYLAELEALLYDRIEGIDFSKYKFGTFFTFGAPYSLILKNAIPFTYVNNRIKPDFFIFNNLKNAHRRGLPSSIVFSPLEFEDEETAFVVRKLLENLHYVKKLVGEEASSYNIDSYVKEYPFEILHICSHGGEVEGSHISEEFTDRDGIRHIVEYDEVVSFAPSRGKELIPVTIKRIWRKFDGLEWKSKELDDVGYPHYVFSDMFQELREKKGIVRKDRGVITDSCAIKCNDFTYQAMFNKIAGEHTNPIIFNNTCWSWYHIAEFFISSGSIGYIGTLWAVNNALAKTAAETFYNIAFENTLLESLQEATVHLEGTDNEHIYMFWGLHFARFQAGESMPKSRMIIANRLLNSIYGRRDQLENTQDSETKELVKELIDWNYNQLETYFFKELLVLTLSNR